MTAPHLRRRTTKWQRSDGARRSRERRAEDRNLPAWARKEQAPCCLAQRDEMGRFPIGWCGPACIRRAS